MTFDRWSWVTHDGWWIILDLVIFDDDSWWITGLRVEKAGMVIYRLEKMTLNEWFWVGDSWISIDDSQPPLYRSTGSWLRDNETLIALVTSVVGSAIRSLLPQLSASAMKSLLPPRHGRFSYVRPIASPTGRSYTCFKDQTRCDALRQLSLLSSGRSSLLGKPSPCQLSIIIWNPDNRSPTYIIYKLLWIKRVAWARASKDYSQINAFLVPVVVV